LEFLHEHLLATAEKHNWKLEAWAVFSNHYHFVAQSPPTAPTAESLSAFITELHSLTGRFINARDGTEGRQIWQNYRESLLTYEKSYFARLNYTHQNAVRHGLAVVANQYPWCSAAWFESIAKPGQVKAIYQFKTDRVNVVDDFSPILDPEEE
jgi:putative transposase